MSVALVSFAPVGGGEYIPTPPVPFVAFIEAVSPLRCRIEMDTPCLLSTLRGSRGFARHVVVRRLLPATAPRVVHERPVQWLRNGSPRDDRLNPRSFVDLLHWDVARDTNWDKITERRNGNQSSEGARIFDMRELRSNKKRLSRFPPDHHPRNPTFSFVAHAFYQTRSAYSSEMTPFSDT